MRAPGLSGSEMQEGGGPGSSAGGPERASLSSCVAGAQGTGRALGGGGAEFAQPVADLPSQDKLAERKALLLQAVQR